MESALPSLMKYVEIDNMSKGYYTTEEWNNEGWDKLMKAAIHLKTWIENSGLKNITTL